MPARDSSGRRISLLNDDSAQTSNGDPYFNRPNYGAPEMMRSSSRDSLPSSAASPATPDLMRADSCDSQKTSEPRSPVTPDSITATGRPASYIGGSFKDSIQQQHHYDHQRMHSFDYTSQPHYQMASRPSYGENRNSPYSHPHMYDDEPYPNHSANVPITERGQKRYVCRYANEFNCDKTFTTSGHASRHSKIHTAEKAVPCSYDGCPKKFTRSDNMKQHLETHFKERSRSSTGGRPASQILTKPAGFKKAAYPSRSSSVSELSPIGTLDPALRLPAPAASHQYSSLNMSPSFKHALESTESSRSGLDTLAMAAAQSAIP
jgi:uncharacterized Zn-finger protein